MMPENVDTSGLIHKGVARTLTYPSGIVKATLFENKKKNSFILTNSAGCLLCSVPCYLSFLFLFHEPI